jgi:hypothetical protein
MRTRWPWEAEPGAGESFTDEELSARCNELVTLLNKMALWPKCRPLAMAGGAIRAIELNAVPDEPGWQTCLEAITHVQTSSLEVCEALARDDRSFAFSCFPEVENQRLEDALKALAPQAKVVKRICYWPELPDHLMPLAQLSSYAWACWDRDLEKRVVCAEIYGDYSNVVGPIGPLPYRVAHPSEASWHLNVEGEGWAAAMHAGGKRNTTHVLAAPKRFGLFRPSAYPDFTSESMIFWWQHKLAAGELSLATLPSEYFGPHEFIGAAWLENGLVRIAQVGRFSAMRWRAGELTQLTEPDLVVWQYLKKAEESHSRGELSFAELESMRESSKRLRGIITNSVTAQTQELRVSEVRLEPGDRLVLMDTTHTEVFGKDVLLKHLGCVDLRQGVDEIRQLLQAHGIGDAVMVLTPLATCTLRTTPVSFALSNETIEQPYEGMRPYTARALRFDTWSYYPSGRTLPSKPRPSLAGPGVVCTVEKWHAAREALAKAALEGMVSPKGGDIVVFQFGAAPEIHLIFHLGQWIPLQDGPAAVGRYSARTRTLEGRIKFSEDERPLLTRVAGARAFDGLANAAQAEGLTNFAWYLECLEVHRRGIVCAGLRVAESRVSRATVKACKDLFPPYGEGVFFHQVSVTELVMQPERYHFCNVRFYAIAHEFFERMHVAGAWWSPEDLGPAPFLHSNGGLRYGRIDAFWESTGDGHGRNGLWPAVAKGSLKVPKPAPPMRRVSRPLQSERAGIPLLVTARITQSATSWSWTLGNTEYQQGVPGFSADLAWPTFPHRCEVDIVVVHDGSEIMPLQVQARRNLERFEVGRNDAQTSLQGAEFEHGYKTDARSNSPNHPQRDTLMTLSLQQQALVELETHMRALDPCCDEYWESKPRRRSLRAATDSAFRDQMGYGTRASRWAPLPWPEDTRSRWRVIREFIECYLGVDVSDIVRDYASSRVAALKQDYGPLGESITQWVALVDELRRHDKLRDVFRDDPLFHRVASQNKFVSMMMQGEGDYEWSVHENLLASDDPPVTAFILDWDKTVYPGGKVFVPDNSFPEYGPYGSYPRLTDFIRAHLNGYLRSVGQAFGASTVLVITADSVGPCYADCLPGVWAAPMVPRLRAAEVADFGATVSSPTSEEAGEREQEPPMLIDEVRGELQDLGCEVAWELEQDEPITIDKWAKWSDEERQQQSGEDVSDWISEMLVEVYSVDVGSAKPRTLNEIVALLEAAGVRAKTADDLVAIIKSRG